MDEGRIKKAIDFLKNNKIKNVSYDEKVQYLRNKLTEEELSEAISRLNKKEGSKEDIQIVSQTTTNPNPASTMNQYSTPIPTSPSIYQHKPRKSGGNKLMAAVNVGAISAVSSIAVSYLINNMKDKKEQEVDFYFILKFRYFNV